jgi:hypothetical protein
MAMQQQWQRLGNQFIWYWWQTVSTHLCIVRFAGSPLYAICCVLQVLQMIPEESHVGLITFGMHVHVHELGFSECSKCFVFRGSKEYTSAQVRGGAGMQQQQHDSTCGNAVGRTKSSSRGCSSSSSSSSTVMAVALQQRAAAAPCELSAARPLRTAATACSVSAATHPSFTAEASVLQCICQPLAQFA